MFNRLLDIVGVLTKGSVINNRKANNQKIIVNKNKRRKPTIMKCKDVLEYDGMPIYRLDTSCMEYRLASNGKKFTVINVKIGESELPVPLWEDDNRKPRQLKNQAKYNKRSRENVNAVAKKG